MALDKYLPADWSEVVYTGNNNDSALLKRFHHDEKKEKDIRKQFAKHGTLPRILIVTEKLLTGYDAPVLYAMYLDKPMRDHTLLQAIARVKARRAITPRSSTWSKASSNMPMKTATTRC